MSDILTLSTFFSSAVSTVLVDMVERILVNGGKLGLITEGDNDADDDAYEVTSPWAVGICMQTLAKRDFSEWRDKADIGAWTRTCLTMGWGQSCDVLAGLHVLSQAVIQATRFVVRCSLRTLPL